MAISLVLGAPGCVLTVMISIHGSPIKFSALVFCFIWPLGILSMNDPFGLNTWKVAIMAAPAQWLFHLALNCVA